MCSKLQYPILVLFGSDPYPQFLARSLFANIYLLLVISSFFRAKKKDHVACPRPWQRYRLHVLVTSPCLPNVRNIDSVRESRTVWRVKTRWFFLEILIFGENHIFSHRPPFFQLVLIGGEINQIPIFQGKSFDKTKIS